MASIKISLESAELKAVKRLAEEMKVDVEDLAYAALNRMMLVSDEKDVRDDVLQTRAWRKDNLPMWSDSAGSIHAYEGMPDLEPQPRKGKMTRS
jgi:hypothetical protein